MNNKPCPFCGDSYWNVDSQYDKSFVVCDFCAAYGPSFDFVTPTKKEWDKRS